LAARPRHRDRRETEHWPRVGVSSVGFLRVVLGDRSRARPHKKVETAMHMRLASIAIFTAFSLAVPAKAESFNREDLDCAVAATIKDARADKDTTADSSFFHEMMIFFLRRLNTQDDQTNWARVVYDRSKLNPKRYSADLLAKCTELYQISLPR
jgi:hypothetical protein